MASDLNQISHVYIKTLISINTALGDKINAN